MDREPVSRLIADERHRLSTHETGDELRYLRALAEGGLNDPKSQDDFELVVKTLALQKALPSSVIEDVFGILLSASGLEAAERFLAPFLAARPDDTILQISHAYALRFRGQFAEAERIFSSLPPSQVREYQLGWHDLYRGDIVSGFRRMAPGRKIWRWGVYGFDGGTREPNWNGERLEPGQPLFVIGEGGSGDEILALSLAANLKAKTGATLTYFVRENFVEIAKRIPSITHAFPLQSLTRAPQGPWLGGLEIEKFLSDKSPQFPVPPALTPRPDKLNEWTSRLQLLRRNYSTVVAVRASGASSHELERYRRPPEEEFARLAAKFPNTAFIGVYTREESEPSISAPNWFSLAHYIESWEDTLAVLSAADTVVSTCTGVAHASSLLGQRTYVLSPIWPYHAWTQRSEESFWYGPHVRIIKPEKFGDWPSAFARLQTLLADAQSSRRDQA